MELTDNSLRGLREALERLPRSDRAPALQALKRLIFEDGFGVREPPREVIVHRRTTGQRLLATLFIMHGGGYSFHLFLVRCVGGGHDLVVARIYQLFAEYLFPPIQ